MLFYCQELDTLVKIFTNTESFCGRMVDIKGVLYCETKYNVMFKTSWSILNVAHPCYWSTRTSHRKLNQESRLSQYDAPGKRKKICIS